MMNKKYVIYGGKPLRGNVRISGMKNSALPILCATVLIGDSCVIDNLPYIRDIDVLLEILKVMGAEVEYLNDEHSRVRIDTKNVVPGSSPLKEVEKIRGSYYLMGAELGRFGSIHVGLPGGDKISTGSRPIDMHLKGFEALGANCSMNGRYVNASTDDELTGNHIFFDMPSVGATANTMIAATLAEGETVINGAAKEPHIVDLATFLSAAGANITGAGTSVIKIRGVKKLHSCEHTLIPDMIEAGTYMTIAAATMGDITVERVIPKHLETVTQKLRQMGIPVEQPSDDSLRVIGDPNMRAVDIDTQPYPGFPTDMQSQFAVLLSVSHGSCLLRENIWKNRFHYYDALKNAGGNISLSNDTLFIVGVEKLNPSFMRCNDLRCGAAQTMIALLANGRSEVSDIYWVERGYSRFVEKLSALGADIHEEDDPESLGEIDA